MSNVPTGTITLVFTDIQGSTALWEHLGKGFQPLLDQHNELLRSAIAAFDLPALNSLQQTIRQEALPSHQVPIWAAVTEALEIPLEQAARMFLFLTLRSLISSAVRLHVTGPLAVQALQYQIGPFSETLVESGLARSLAEISQTAPLMEMLQGTQDRMYSRLFQS